MVNGKVGMEEGVLLAFTVLYLCCLIDDRYLTCVLSITLQTTNQSIPSVQSQRQAGQTNSRLYCILKCRYTSFENVFVFLHSLTYTHVWSILYCTVLSVSD